MTKTKFKKSNKKRELEKLRKNIKLVSGKKFGIDEDQTEIYNRGWYTAYNLSYQCWKITNNYQHIF